MQAKTWIVVPHQVMKMTAILYVAHTKSYGGTGGLQYLFPQPAHLEIFPEIVERMNGVDSWAIGGCGGGGKSV